MGNNSILDDDEFKWCIKEIDRLSGQDYRPIIKASGQSSPQELLGWVHQGIEQRIKAIGDIIINTETSQKKQIEDAILLFKDWMLNGTIVRIIGAGRAKLAGSIPANRLAHGGARVYIKDDNIPMPHTSKGGGIIAVSASGKTNSVLEDLKDAREKVSHIKIVGFADKNAEEFQKLCHIFIGIDLDTTHPVPLQALADTGEYVISELFDAMVVAAGKMAGFDEVEWRIGHENIGSTGPYDANSKVEGFRDF